MNRLSSFVMLALAAPTLAGCSYHGPGSSGVISLGPGLDASGYQTLALRAFDNRRGSVRSLRTGAGRLRDQPAARPADVALAVPDRRRSQRGQRLHGLDVRRVVVAQDGGRPGNRGRGHARIPETCSAWSHSGCPTPPTASRRMWIACLPRWSRRRRDGTAPDRRARSDRGRSLSRTAGERGPMGFALLPVQPGSAESGRAGWRGKRARRSRSDGANARYGMTQMTPMPWMFPHERPAEHVPRLDEARIAGPPRQGGRRPRKSRPARLTEGSLSAKARLFFLSAGRDREGGDHVPAGAADAGGRAHQGGDHDREHRDVLHPERVTPALAPQLRCQSVVRRHGFGWSRSE